jgi:hypothetical protein
MSAGDKVIMAARELVEAKCATLKNGHGIEMEDGEKGYIVHSDHIFALEAAIAEYDKRRAAMKATSATGG